MTDIFSALAHDHHEVKGILDRLEAGGASHPQAGSETFLEDRRQLAEQLVIDESQHEAAEEQYFWPVVRDKLANGDTLAEQAIAQETEGKQVLDKLRKLEPGDGEFDTLVREFVTAGREHIAFEEQQVWPELRATLTDEESTALAEKYELAMKMGPTRPHPHTPPKPAVLKTAGVAAAVVDKAVDAVTGRGKDK
jgi:hemerythrin-like domain-containing protein